MRRSYFIGLVAAVAAIASGAAVAAPTVQIVGIQPGIPGSNCGSGLHSTFLSGTVTEFNFDGVNGSVPTTCSGGINAGPSTNYGPIGNNSFSTALGQIAFSGTGDIIAGTQGGFAGAPWADSSPYLVTEVTPDFTKLDLTGLTTKATYFGLYWGSVDGTADVPGNVLTFKLSNGDSVAISGGDLPGAAASLSYNGDNQTNTLTNVFVDFLATGGATIDSVTFTDSPSPAFEVDNLAFGNISVPEPITLSLFGFGLAGLGVIRRRKAA